MKKFSFLILILIYSCSEKKVPEAISTNDHYEKAWKSLDEKQNTQAFIEFDKAKNLFLKNKDSLGVGKCLMNMAIIQEQMGDNFGSQETGLNALNFLKKEDKENADYLSANYNSLGISSINLKEFQNAISFYSNAINFSTNELDRKIYSNNLANVYKKLRNYNEAIKIYNNILEETPKDNIEYARILSNLSFTKWLQNPNYNPVPEFHKALNIRFKEKDDWGLNSSFSHLADYYAYKQKDSALLYASKMYDVSKKIKSPDDQIEALQKLIPLENQENAKQHFKVFQNLNDSLQTARNKAKNQFAFIRYETEKNKADFLRSKAESTQRQNHIIKQYFGLGILIVALLLSYLWFIKRQKALRQEKLLEVKNTELKYSKKVHDRVANKVYQVMSEVENIKDLRRETLLDNLEEIYEISRDISYEQEEFEAKNFRDQLSRMLVSYSSDLVKIFIIGNEDETWKETSHNQRNEVFCILQELMTNMKKHSQADKVSVRFTKENNDVKIAYTDNGIGIKHISPKNGLRNTENRTKAINGTITFDTETDRNLKINISFPI